MKTKVLFPSLFCITMFVAARAVLAGEPVHVISITENSPISLSVTYDGSSSGIMVDLTSSDHWAVTLPTTVNLSPLDVGAWREPENSMRLNEAFRAANSVDSFRMTVISDSSNFPEAIPVNDGAFVLMGTDTRDRRRFSRPFTTWRLTSKPSPTWDLPSFSLPCRYWGY